MPADRNSAIEKAIQPMIEMLEARSQARQQRQAAQLEDQKAQLLQQVMPMQIQAAGRDYKESKAAEAEKAAKQGQAGAKQPQVVPKARPVSTGDPMSSMGTDAAARLTDLIEGGAGVQAGGMRADRTAASGIQGQGAPAQQGQPGGQPAGQFEVPGQTVRTASGSPEPFWKQMLRGHVGAPQIPGQVQSQVTPPAETFVARGALSAEAYLIKNPGGDPMNDPGFKAYAERITTRLGPERAKGLLAESVTLAQSMAEKEIRKRTLEDGKAAEEMFAEGYSKEEVDLEMKGRKIGSVALITKARASRETLSEIGKRLDIEARKLTNRAAEMRLDMLNETKEHRTLLGWVNPNSPYAGPGGAKEKREAILLGVGASADASPKSLREAAVSEWKQRSGMVSRDQESVTKLLKEYYSELTVANELDINDNGRMMLYDHEKIAAGETDVTAFMMDIPELARDVSIMHMATMIGGLTFEQYIETAPGARLDAKLAQYGFSIDAGDLTLYADREHHMVKAQNGSLGEGAAPLMDQVGLAVSRMAEYTIMSGQEAGDITLNITNLPIKHFDEMMTPEFWQEYYARGKAGDVAQAGLYTEPDIVGETPEGATDVPTEESMTWPSMVGGIPVGDLNISAEELASRRESEATEPRGTQPEWPPPNVVGRSPEARALMEELFKGAVPPDADEKIRKLLGMTK